MAYPLLIDVRRPKCHFVSFAIKSKHFLTQNNRRFAVEFIGGRKKGRFLALNSKNGLVVDI